MALIDPNTLRMSIRNMYPEWTDMTSPATTLKVPAGLNPPTWDDVNVGWLFEGSGAGTPDEALFAIFHVPHSYREGTSLEPHVHWQATDNAAGDVYWQLEWSWMNDGEVQPAMTTQFITPATSGTALTMQLSEFADITKANARIASTVKCILTRLSTNVLDTYNNADALLSKFDIHFRQDSLGSVDDLLKWG